MEIIKEPNVPEPSLSEYIIYLTIHLKIVTKEKPHVILVNIIMLNSSVKHKRYTDKICKPQYECKMHTISIKIPGAEHGDY